ncbi:MAG TPA: ATP-binding protein [Mycobacteriales bacterium]
MTGLSARPATGTRYRLLLDLAREVTAQRDLGAVLDQTFIALRRVLDFTGGSIALVDDEGWISFAATDPPATPEAMAMRIRVGDGIVGRIVAEGEPQYVADIHTHPDVTPERRAKSVSAGVISWFGVPLITEGRAIGALQIDSPVPDAWDEEDRLLLMSFTPIVAAAVQNARVYARERAALRRLEELDQRHRDFVAIVSHELRTPLTAVMGYTDTVLTYQDSLDQESIFKLVERSRVSAGRLAALVEELLELSVIQRGELRLSLAPVDVPALVRGVVSRFENGRVAVDVPETLPQVVTDAERLAQVLGNLLSNAVKFSPPDAPIEVSARCADDLLELRVADRGIGISPEDLDRVFERFVQLERANVRKIGGIGIGLYVVRQVCDALGATVSAESEVGAGSTFVVRVPMRPALDIVAQRA